MIKLNLGCGKRHIPHYVNIDIDETCNPDKIEDISTLPSFEYNSVDLIYCAHVLEHFPTKQVPFILNRWKDVLKTNGIIRISVPDLNSIFCHYILHKDLTILNKLLYGEQSNEYHFHKSGWDFKTMQKLLRRTGFENIKRFNWKDLEHHYIDDYSQAYLPHMQKETGTLMSLNIEGTKI